MDKNWSNFCKDQEQRMTLKLGVLRRELSECDPNSDDDVKIIERYTYKIKKIIQALTRVSRGRYGKCIGCYQPISRQRLKILPEAEHCMACASESLTQKT